MPERYVQQALGHNSKAFARACSKKAKVIVPSSEDYEAKIVPMPAAVNQQIKDWFIEVSELSSFVVSAKIRA